MAALMLDVVDGQMAWGATHIKVAVASTSSTWEALAAKCRKPYRLAMAVRCLQLSSLAYVD